MRRQITDPGSESSQPVQVGILARVSSAQQAKKISIEQQVAACNDQAAALSRELSRPVNVANIYKDAGVSGDGRDRDALTEALQDVKAGRIRYVIVYDIDRLSRDPLQGLTTLQKCNEAGAQIIVCGMQLRYDPETGDLDFGSLLQYVIKLIMAKEERRVILKRTSRDRLALVQKGIQVQRGRSPYGYKIWQTWEAKADLCRVEDIGRYALSPDLLSHQVIAEIFERIAARDTLRGIAKSLQARGIPSPSGSDMWYAASVHEIVTDTLYKGVAHYGRRKRLSDSSRPAQGKLQDYVVPMPRSEWIPIPAPAIVSEELWQAAANALAENKSFKSGDKDYRFLLSGFLRCPVCGAAMGGRRQGCKDRHYYICGRDYLKRDAGKNQVVCTMKYVRAQVIEARVAQAFKAACENPAVIQSAVKDFLGKAAADARSDTTDKERAALIARKESLARRMRAIRQSMADVRSFDEFADVSGFAEDYAKEAAALAKVEGEIRNLPEARKVADAIPSPSEAARRVAESLRRLPEALASTLMSVAEKRDLLDAILLRAVPIEGAPGPRNSVDWAVRITLRPDAWNRAAIDCKGTSDGVFYSSVSVVSDSSVD